MNIQKRGEVQITEEYLKIKGEIESRNEKARERLKIPFAERIVDEVER